MNIRKTSFFILVLILFCTKAIAQDSATWHHDFTTIAPTGQTLYCYINSSNTCVSIMPPIWRVRVYSDGGYSFVFDNDMSYGTYPKPSGYLEIPSTVTHNGITYPVVQVIMHDCEDLTGVMIPNLANISFWPDYDRAMSFKRCTSLNMVYSNLATSWGEWFEGCTNLNTLSFGEDVNYIIGFNNIPNITHVTINARNIITPTNPYLSITPFSQTLNTLIIGDSVTRLPDYMFAGQTNLTSVISHSVIPPTIYEHTFAGVCTAYGVPTNIPLIVPCGSTDIYRNMPYWSEFTNILEDSTCANTITTATNNINYGMVVGGGNYYDGEMATLYAVPKAYHYFVHWQDGNDDNPRTITVSSDSTFTATFAVVDTLGTIHDTIYIHDTVYVGIDGVDAINAKIYTSRGQIVVDGAESNTVWLYDVNGRVIATKQDEYSPLHFDVPASGAYLVKIGNHPARKVVVIR